MRVSQRLLIDSAVQRLQQNQEALEETRTQIATGRRIIKPDDDPQGTQQAMNLRTYLNGVQSSLRNLSYSRDWMEATEQSLGSLADVLSSARLKALQAANDSLSATERQSSAASVRELFKQATVIANTEHRGQSLFAGHRVDRQPFVADTANLTVTYQGDSGSISHEIEPGSQMVVNVAGSDALFSTAFAALHDLVAALEANDTTQIRAAIDSLDQAADLTLQQRSTIGSRVKTLDAANARLEQFQVNLQSLLSQAEDVDMPEAILKSSSYEMGYQATLAAMSKIMPRSLFDYLG